MRTDRARGPAKGFTLIELLVVVMIVAVLSALVFFAVGAAVRAARRAGEQQLLRSLATAIDQYKQNFGTLPPLVADGPTDASGPLVMNPPSGPARPRFKGEDPADLTRALRFMRYELDTDDVNIANRLRNSKYTIGVYILGAMNKKYDGVEGPGFTRPDSDGVFSRAGSTTQPLLDLGRVTSRLQRDPKAGSEDDEGARTFIVDRWGHAVLYYRWLPTYHTSNGTAAPASVYPGAPGNATGQAKEVRSYNVPPAVGNPLTNGELRSAFAAVVSAGPDGRINDLDPDHPDNQDNLVEVIK